MKPWWAQTRAEIEMTLRRGETLLLTIGIRYFSWFSSRSLRSQLRQLLTAWISLLLAF